VVYRRPELRLNASAVEWLANHAWPGNVRELKHVIERTVLLSSDDVLKVEHFVAASEASGMSEEAGEQLASGLTLDEMERTMILRAIEQCGGNLTKAAQSLGLSRGAFYRRLDKHRIRP
ncbi:MAG: sigma-54-dependent Fis family transcriptional regulator, partial [bacterium]|nr:sigma-54-dependent Fis family transcriptional regulator [bacterium]